MKLLIGAVLICVVILSIVRLLGGNHGRGH